MNLKNWLIFLALNVSIALLCVSCASSTREDPRGLTPMVSVQGSNTMTGLMQDLAERFKKAHPDIPVSITSDDSGSGISALINRTTDVAIASRDLNDAERAQIAKEGERIRKITVAGDAIVVFVNAKNPVSALTFDQLKQIFTGAVKNWREIGGPDSAIQVFTREKESGTSAYFQEHVLRGSPYIPNAQVFPSSQALTQAVEKERGAIAYEGFAIASRIGANVKIIKLKISPEGKAVAPTVASELSDYPLSRPLMMFVDKNAKTSVRQFVEFCASKEGQAIVSKSGYARLR